MVLCSEYQARGIRRHVDRSVHENGLVGIVELSLELGAPSEVCNPGAIARFYSETFGFDMEARDEAAIAYGGPEAGKRSQRIVYQFQSSQANEEGKACAEVAALPYEGDHFCFYIKDFESIFARCEKQGLLYVNPRFTFLDDTRSIE